MTIKSINKPLIFFAAIYAFLSGILILVGLFFNNSELIKHMPFFSSMLNNVSLLDVLLIGFSLFSAALMCFFALIHYSQKHSFDSSSNNIDLSTLTGFADNAWHWDIITNTLNISGPLKELLSTKQDKQNITFDNWIEQLHPDDKDNTLSALNNHIINNTPYNVEFRIQAKDDTWLWYNSRGKAQFDSKGKALQMVGIFNDVTQIKEKNLARERLIEALEKSNKELDNYAYIASHDLKAPLRIIDNISHWLEEDLADRLDNTSRENLVLLRNRVHRMEKLLKDLLAYARIGSNHNENYGLVISGEELIADASLLLTLPEDFNIRASKEFLKLKVNKTPLQLIFVNLIGNAIKHHDKRNGLIDISVQENSHQYIFSVKDDGPGIAAIYHQRIFEMLQTLKPRDQIEGSGLGLSIARKHIELFDGTITVESEVGKGSNFIFTWPKKLILFDKNKSD